MRLLVAFALATVPFALWGWPSHWWVACSSFLAGALGSRSLAHGRSRRPGGSLQPPASSNGNQGVVKRVGTYTGSSRAGRLQAVAATPATPAPESSSGARGSATGGQAAASAMGGYRGLSLVTNAGTSHDERLEAYRRLLTRRQRTVFDELRAEAAALGRVPADALEVLAPFGPWPDPFDDTCEECDK